MTTTPEERNTPQCDELAREHQRGGIDAKHGPGVVQDWIALAQKLERAISDGSRWIPVSERTPDAQFDVLVTDGQFVGTGDCCKGHLWNSPTIDGPVTHWMPLPEPPK